MTDTSTITAIALVSGALALAAQPAAAEVVRYNFTATFDFFESNVDTGNDGSATGFFEYELGAAPSRTIMGTSIAIFDLSSFSVTFSGAPIDGIVLSSTSGDVGELSQSNQNEASITLRNSSFTPQLFLRFGEDAADDSVAALINPDAFISGSGYGNAITNTLRNVSATAQLVDAAVPVPASGALMGLLVGGAALRAAAKRRRAAKHAEA